MNKHSIEYTDTCGGDANYCWVRRAVVTMPGLDYYGYTGSTDGSRIKAHRTYQRELMRKAKAAVGLTGVRGTRTEYGETVEFRPYGTATVMFITDYEED